MDKKDLDQLTEGLGELTYPQLKRIRGIIESLISSNQTGKAIATGSRRSRSAHTASMSTS